MEIEMKKKPTSKPTTTKLKKQLLELVLIWGKIKKADKFGITSCCTCWLVAHWTNLCWGHFIPQAKGDSTRFELDNINAQCSGCNGRANQWEQYKHGLYIDKEFYPWRADEIHIQSRTLRKRKIYEIEDAIEFVSMNIIERYSRQSKQQQDIFVNYVTKNSERKSKCKRILEMIGKI